MDKITNRNKKNNVITRFRNRNSLPVFPDKQAQDVYIIDTTLQELYNEGDRITKKLDKEILRPHRIRISEQEYERIWEILMSTGLVNGVIGFGNTGKLNLTNEGYQLMRQFGSYSSFVEQKEKMQQQQQSGFVLPQFIVTQEEETEGDQANEEKDKQAAAKKDKADDATEG